LHGAVFLSLKTRGDVRMCARGLAHRAGLAAIVLGGAFLVCTSLAYGPGWTIVPVLIAAVALVAAVLATHRMREGWAFLLTATAIIGVTVTLFGSLYPNVLPSTTDPVFSLNTTNASSTPYTLTIMTWVAVVFTPVVVAYQAWF
jgi:cytochrome d ubiquinol oxidase subunit II